MARFLIYSQPATKSYTDGIPFITMTVSVGRDTSQDRREFEATKLDQIKAEYEAQAAMAKIPCVVVVMKISGRAPGGFNDWSKITKFVDPAERDAA